MIGFPKPTKSDKAATRRARADRMAEIRRNVMDRALGLCEVCGETAGEVHHLISGPLRRTLESESTCIALCVQCHGDIHRGELDMLLKLLGWCVASGMTEAAESLRHRIDKVVEARRKRHDDS